VDAGAAETAASRFVPFGKSKTGRREVFWRRCGMGFPYRPPFRLASAPGPKLTPMKLWLVISVLWTVPLAGALLFVLFAH
jgi:hypothetical protein